MADDNTLLDALQDFQKFADTTTGMRAQLIDLGWPSDQAGELVITALRSGQ